jgi:catechol 2,3-dioxygenase-like lactoylglutathione lyase family enzyme
MINAKTAFSGFSVDDAAKAKTFYTETLGLKLAGEEMGLDLELPGGGKIFVYEKADHQPATFTILNFVVDNIDEAVDQLTTAGVVFEQYDNEYIKTDEKGIARPPSPDQGPNIAWFKDPAGNILAVLEG